MGARVVAAPGRPRCAGSCGNGGGTLNLWDRQLFLGLIRGANRGAQDLPSDVAGHGKKQAVRRLHERHKPELGIERHCGIVDGVDEKAG